MLAPTTFFGFKCPEIDRTPEQGEFIESLQSLRKYSRQKGKVVGFRGVTIRQTDGEGGEEMLVGAEWNEEAACFMVEEARANLPEGDAMQMAVHEWERDVYIPAHNHAASDQEKYAFLDLWAGRHLEDLIEMKSEQVQLTTYSVVMDFERSRGYIGSSNLGKASDVLAVLQTLLKPLISVEHNWDEDAGLMVFPGLMDLVRDWLITGAAEAPWLLGRSCTIKGSRGEKIAYDKSQLDLDSIREYLVSGEDMKVVACELILKGPSGEMGDSLTAVVSKGGAISRFTNSLVTDGAQDPYGIHAICWLASRYLDALQDSADKAAGD